MAKAKGTKRKAAAAPEEPAAPKNKAKHAGGRPTKLEEAVRDAGETQKSIASMFGKRDDAVRPPSKQSAPFKSDVKKWTWSGVGGDDQLEQKALLGGNVAWTIHDPPKHATLVAVGSKETEETYYVDKEDDSKEVDAEDPNRNPNPRKRGAEGQLRIKVFVWLATLACTRPPPVAVRPTRQRRPAPTHNIHASMCHKCGNYHMLTTFSFLVSGPSSYLGSAPSKWTALVVGIRVV